MSHPLITIGLTSFNAASTIERAMNSALAQSWRPIEIVAVDDCSTDGTRDILQRAADRHPEVRVFSNPENAGVAVSRNRILKEARGDFVVFFDDDDESLPHRIKSQYSRITAYERKFASDAPVICHTARELAYPDGRRRIETTMGLKTDRQAPRGPDVARRILLGTPLDDGYGACPTCSQMARLGTYRLVDGFDPAFLRSEDTDLNIRLAEAGAHFVGIAEPLVIQTLTKTSEKSLASEYHFMRQLLNKHRKFLEQEGQLEFTLRWLDIKQAWLEGRRIAFFSSLAALALAHPALTLNRLHMALPNVAANRAFSRFHNTKMV